MNELEKKLARYRAVIFEVAELQAEAIVHENEVTSITERLGEIHPDNEREIVGAKHKRRLTRQKLMELQAKICRLNAEVAALKTEIEALTYVGDLS